MPSAERKVESNDGEKDRPRSIESGKEKGKEMTVEEGEGKVEVCLAEGEWEESRVTVEEEYKDKEGVVWFSSVVEAYERKKREERRRAFERVRTQGLIRDFPNLKVGGLLPNPPAIKETYPYVKEWNVIVASREEELRREREWKTKPFDEGPDERGWIRHRCCGTICAVRSLPPPRQEPKGFHGVPRR